MMTKPFTLLIKDHAKVKRMVAQMLEESTSPDERAKMLVQLRQELVEHEDIEESAVYPVLEKKAATKDLARESYEEHHLVDILLDELAQMDPASDEWIAKLTVLQENLLHHIDEEEQNLFPDAEENLSEGKLKQMQHDIKQLKSEQQ
jgi:hemerythrin superfamily protein